MAVSAGGAEMDRVVEREVECLSETGRHVCAGGDQMESWVGGSRLV